MPGITMSYGLDAFTPPQRKLGIMMCTGSVVVA